MPRRVWGQVYYRKDTGNWCLRFPNGRTPSGRTSYTCRAIGPGPKGEKLAKRLLGQAHREYVLGRLKPAKPDTPGRLTVAQMLAAYIDSVDRPEKTVTSYRRTLALLGPLGEKAAADVTPSDIEVWLRSLKVGRASKRRHYGILRAAFTRAIRDRAIKENPAAYVARPKAPKRPKDILRHGEIERLRRVCDGDMRVVLFLGLYAGPRSGEMLALTWGDIDLDARTVLIRRTKTSNSSTVRLHREVVEVLKEHRAAAPRVPQPTDRVLSVRFVWHAFRTRLDRAGITRPRISPHSLRHTFASHFIARGGSLRRLQSILGHSSLSTTEQYVRDLPELEETDIDALDFGGGERTASVPDGAASA
jgi:integrase/recombinase XerD